MENTISYTENDRDAVKILRDAYTAVYSIVPAVLDSYRASDVLYNARQYLQDRARYERMHPAYQRSSVTLGRSTSPYREVYR